MSILGEFLAEHGGKIRVKDPISFSIKNKLPFGNLKLFLIFDSEFGKYQANKTERSYNVSYDIGSCEVVLRYDDIELASNFPWSYGNWLPLFPSNDNKIDFTFKLDVSTLSFIESKRTNDVPLSLFITGTYRSSLYNGPPMPIELNKFWFNCKWKLSHSEWINFLSEMGYAEKLVIEMDRPKLEGLNEVIEHLNKAQDALYNKKEPEDVLRDLRSALNSFKIFYKSKKEELAELIDLGSPGEVGKDNKSVRVYKMYEDISKFLQLGPHNDKYEVTYADAQLAFRQFVSMLSYISSYLIKIGDDMK